MNRHPAIGKTGKLVKASLSRAVLVAPLVAMIAIGIVSCTSETDGQPTATDSTPTARPTLPGSVTGPPKTTSPGRPGASSSPVRNIDPCALLTPIEANSVGVAEGKRDDSSAGTSRSCELVASGTFNLRINVFDVLGTKDVQSRGEIKPLPPIGKHQAVQTIDGGACATSIATSETSRVDSVVVARGDTTKACQISMQVAQLVEPKLPV
jgi:hypothetical protein